MTGKFNTVTATYIQLEIEGKPYMLTRKSETATTAVFGDLDRKVEIAWSHDVNRHGVLTQVMFGAQGEGFWDLPARDGIPVAINFLARRLGIRG